MGNDHLALSIQADHTRIKVSQTSPHLIPLKLYTFNPHASVSWQVINSTSPSPAPNKRRFFVQG